MTGFAKTVPNGTRTKIQLMPKCYTPAQSRYNKHMAIYRWPSLLLQTAFCSPCQTMNSRCISGSVQPVNNINKDICGAKLLPKVVSAYVRILWIVSVSVAY